MKTNLYIILVFLITCSSCYKEVTIPQNNSQTFPVINCLFNQDSIWKVNISTTKNTDNNSTQTYVSNAEVELFANNSFQESLIYLGKGDYISKSNSTPKIDISYKVIVKIPGFNELIAEDRIPKGLDIHKATLDSNMITITPYIFSDPVKTYPVSVSLSDTESIAKYYMLRPLFYDKEELNIYKITQKTIDTLSRLKLFFSKEDSLRFSSMLNHEYLGISDFKRNLMQVFNGLGYTIRIFEYAYFKTFNTYYPQYFFNQRAYVKDNYFRHIADDYYSIFGEKKPAIKLTNYDLMLFYNAIPGGNFTVENGQLITKKAEWYLDVYTLSESGYKYYSSYLQNLANRNNPFAEHINVYSNVKNGIGIFAGVNQQRIKID